MEWNSLHYENQFGFRLNRGIQQIIALTTEQTAHNKGDGGQCQVILRDITNTF